ncbi:MAG: tetratricopeptide repeat protein [Bacteroidales bacterium]|nr:tetratricopeptide repeat protein [Bacteroidales bacterium]
MPAKTLIASALLAWVLLCVGAMALGAQPDDGQPHLEAELLRTQQAHPDTAVNHAAQQALRLIHSGTLPQLLQAELHLGELLYARNSYNLALTHLSTALHLAQQLGADEQEARCLARMGNVMQLKGQYARALEHYEQAAKLNRRLGNQQQLARVLVSQGTAFALTGSNMHGVELMLDALNLLEGMADTEGMAWTSLSISRLFNRIGLGDKAMQYAEQALNLYRSIQNSNGELLSLTEQANINFGERLYPEALRIARQVLEANTKGNNTHGMAGNHLLLGIIYYHTDSLQLALQHLNRAHKLKHSLNDSLNLSRLNVYLGKTHIAMGQQKIGLGHLRTALLLAQQQHLQADLGEAHLGLSELYDQQGMHQLALQHYRSYAAIHDSLNTTAIARLEMQYDFEKREQERELIARQRDEIQRVKLQRQRIISAFLVGALVLAIAFASVVFRFLHEKQRSNQMLTERNAEIEQQKHEIETQQQQITSSITYASRIQKAILPMQHTLDEHFAEHFVIYQPKNIVSGDFYWVGTLADGRLAVVVADCTGHGVPGAFMSILGVSLLKDLTASRNQDAGDILFHLRRMVIALLHQTGRPGESHDGIDMALALFDRDGLQLQFAGAYSSLLVARHDQQPPVPGATAKSLNGITLYELRGDKQPVGYHLTGERPFRTLRMGYHPSDTFYMASDGYPDQFGGQHNFKIMMSGFKELLLQAQPLPLAQQGDFLLQRYEQYKGAERQTDDVVVMGFRVRE